MKEPNLINLPGLKVTLKKDGFFLITGVLPFRCVYQDKEEIEDAYEIEILWPSGRKGILPTVKETGGRIFRAASNHINNNGALCLAANYEIYEFLAKDSTVDGFINKFVIPFFYGVSYKQKHDKWPWKDLSHGEQGILEFYKDFFQTDSDKVALLLLKIIVAGNYRGNSRCPCGSGQQLKKCHGNKIKTMKQIMSIADFTREFASCIRFYRKKHGHVPNTLDNRKLNSRLKRRGIL